MSRFSCAVFVRLRKTVSAPAARTPHSAGTSRSTLPHGAVAMQLHRVPPPLHRLSIDLGSQEHSFGVEHPAEESDLSRIRSTPIAARRITWRGGWGIVRSVGEASMPEWTPILRAVDI